MAIAARILLVLLCLTAAGGIVSASVESASAVACEECLEGGSDRLDAAPCPSACFTAVIVAPSPAPSLLRFERAAWRIGPIAPPRARPIRPDPPPPKL